MNVDFSISACASVAFTRIGTYATIVPTAVSASTSSGGLKACARKTTHTTDGFVEEVAKSRTGKCGTTDGAYENREWIYHITGRCNFGEDRKER